MFNKTEGNLFLRNFNRVSQKENQGVRKVVSLKGVWKEKLKITHR